MKRQSRAGKKILVMIVSVMLLAVMFPGRVSAEEEVESEAHAEQDATIPGDMVFPVVLPMEAGAELDQLSQFLSLSADRFTVYMAAFVDMTGNPAAPGKEMEISLPVPADYDMDRLAVSEITLDGQTPQRTEIAFEMRDQGAVCATDHAGIFVVMEKKVQPDLPASLELTEKVEKLELTKREPPAERKDPSPAVQSAGVGASQALANPATGDDSNAAVFVVMIGAAAAVIGAIVIKRNR